MIEFYQKIDRLNKLPINQEAKRFLQQTEEKVDLSELHLYQLVQWALEYCKIQVNDLENKNHAYSDLRNTVDFLMHRADPQEAMDLLLEQGPDQWTNWADIEDLKKCLTPEDAASYLGEQIQAAVQSENPSRVQE